MGKENKMGRMQKKVKSIYSIRGKLIGIIIPIVSIFLVTITTTSFLYSKRIISENIKSLMNAEGATGVNQVLSWMTSNLTSLDTMTKAMDDLDMSHSEILEYLKCNINKNDDIPNGIYLTYENDLVLDGAGWIPEGIPTEGTWYKEGITHPEFQFGKPYLDGYTNEYIVTASKYLPNLNGTMDAVAAADLSLNKLVDVVANIQVAETGQAFIVDKDTNIIIAHKDKSYLGSVLSSTKDLYYERIGEKIQASEVGQSSILSDHGSVLTEIKRIEGTNWYFIVQVLEGEIYKELFSLRRFMIFLGIIMVLVLSLILERIIAFMVHPIKKLTSTIINITDGDFTEEIVINGKDEIAIMANCMVEFLHSMRNTIGSLSNISNQLNEKSDQGAIVSSKLNDSSSIQLDSMVDMTKTVTELVSSINEIAQSATKLAEAAARNDENGNVVVSHMDETKIATDQGQKDMNMVRRAMEVIQSSMKELENMIMRVGEAAKKVQLITDTITHISEETDLLSLNASIEAAQAGEAGKGFLVVAFEIKKLAEISANSALEIKDVIASITELIEQTVAKSQNNMQGVLESKELVDHTYNSFEQIYDSVTQTSNVMNDMIERTKMVNDIAVSLASITQEQSASAEEIEATSEHVIGMAKEVAQNSSVMQDDAEELNKMSKEVYNQIKRFKI